MTLRIVICNQLLNRREGSRDALQDMYDLASKVWHGDELSLDEAEVIMDVAAATGSPLAYGRIAELIGDLSSRWSAESEEKPELWIDNSGKGRAA